MSTANTPVTPGTELLTINPNELLESMPALITEMDTSIAKAQAIEKALPKIVDEETKQQHFKFKETLTLRLSQYKERRMPFTRKLNEIVKLFTTREAEYERLLKLTDDKTSAYARQELAASRAAQDLEDKKLAAKQAAINLEGRIRETLQSRINDMLDKVRNAAGNLVKKVTKENLDDTKKKLSKKPVWMKDVMDPQFFDKPDWVADNEQWSRIANEVFPAMQTDYLTKAKEILDGSLKIAQVAITNKEEAELLQKAQTEHDKAEEQRKAEELQKELDGKDAMAQLDKEHIEAPKVRVKMKIDVLENEGWLQMIAFWFANDPESKTKDLSKKTFLQCKTFCEKACNDTGAIIEHKSLTYIEDVKAR